MDEAMVKNLVEAIRGVQWTAAFACWVCLLEALTVMLLGLLLARTMVRLARLDAKLAEHLANDPRYYRNPQKWSDQL